MAAFLAAATACEDRFADAVVANAGVVNPPQGGAGAAAGTGAGGEGGADLGAGVGGGQMVAGGLCAGCQDSADCGAEADLCLRSVRTGQVFCGAQCVDGVDCPPGYQCVPLDDAPAVMQCVPTSGSCSDSFEGLGDNMPSHDELVEFTLSEVNELRTERGLLPYVLDDCLAELGAEAVAELASEGTFQTKFVRECAPVRPECRCGWQAESQAWVSLVERTWQDAIRLPLLRAEANNPQGDFFDNVVSRQLTRIGIGIAIEGNDLRFSLEFAP